MKNKVYATLLITALVMALGVSSLYARGGSHTGGGGSRGGRSFSGGHHGGNAGRSGAAGQGRGYNRGGGYYGRGGGNGAAFAGGVVAGTIIGAGIGAETAAVNNNPEEANYDDNYYGSQSGYYDQPLNLIDDE